MDAETEFQTGFIAVLLITVVFVLPHICPPIFVSVLLLFLSSCMHGRRDTKKGKSGGTLELMEDLVCARSDLFWCARDAVLMSSVCLSMCLPVSRNVASVAPCSLCSAL